MATIAIPRPIPSHQPASTLDTPITPPFSHANYSSVNSLQKAAPAHNKHIPECPTGPAQPDTPPLSPKTPDEYCQISTLFPPHSFPRVDSGSLRIYEIEAASVADAIDFSSRQPLPDPNLVFPWFHGLHPHNHLQQAFFSARNRNQRRTPSCLRGVTVVKADGTLSRSRLKGAISPEELIHTTPSPEFVEADPREGFSVRNFQIQPAKIALISDIIVYGDDSSETRRVAWDVAAAQSRWRESRHADVPEYNTFICTTPFSYFEKNHSELVCIDSSGRVTGEIMDFIQQERMEMRSMTEASEITHNVFLGPSPELGSAEEREFDILIDCSDGGRFNPEALQLVAESLSEIVTQPFHEFPSSGSILPPTYSHAEADAILETCKWIYHLANGTTPADKTHLHIDMDTHMSADDGDEDWETEEEETKHKPRKILIHCADGYTESTMLGIAYFSYCTGRPVPEAWLHLHTTRGRNFFAYPSDVALLTTIAHRLLQNSPACTGKSLIEITSMVKQEPPWLQGLDGSLPSRILDYLYLGNLGHANNPDLLRALGICQVLSVGETATWRGGDMEAWGEENVCTVQGVQDNGIDPLTDDFARCLEFIERGKRKGVATLVHCRVGVSRSATICIAEVMRAFGMSLPRAYCFVRARRLNVIIQPHLRFAYELLRWEEALQQDGDTTAPVKRECEWAELTREIALMNRPYSR